MPATAQSLFNNMQCFACYGLSQGQIMKISMLLGLVVDSDPTADVSPQALLDYAKCFACVGLSLGDIFEIALLNMVSAGGGGGGGTGELFCGHYGGGSPTDTPTGSCAIANDLDSPFNQWIWDGSAWV